MRIAIVDPASWSLAYDGPLGAALTRAGCEVTLHCTRSPHGASAMGHAGQLRIEESFYRSGYGLGVLPRRIGRAVQHPLDLAKLVRRLRSEADAVMVQWLPGRGVDARAWSRLASDVPVTFTAHNAQERLEVVEPALLRGFTAVIAHSEGGAAALRDAGVAAVWRMAIGAYTQYAVAPDPPAPPVTLAPDVPLVVMPGILREYKGVDVLLDAWPRVLDAVPAARCVIAGRPMDVSLPSREPEGVTILPRFVSEEELGWLLRRATICCLPYRRIDMSGIAASALACGTPLVASDVGGLSEHVGRGATLVPPCDPTALAEGLIRVLTDRDERARLSQEARTATETVYSWDTIAREYVQLLGALTRS